VHPSTALQMTWRLPIWRFPPMSGLSCCTIKWLLCCGLWA
jgi:hypothetical protein